MTEHSVHCTNPAADRTPRGAYDAFIFATMQDIRSADEHVLAAAREDAIIAAPSVTVTTELATGNPTRTLIDASAHAHLLVLGATASVGSIAHLGSTLLSVTAHAHGEVVIVRGPDPDRNSGPVVVVSTAAASASLPSAPRSPRWSRTAQLLVVGSRGRGGFRGLMLGSTSNWLLPAVGLPVENRCDGVEPQVQLPQHQDLLQLSGTSTLNIDAA